MVKKNIIRIICSILLLLLASFLQESSVVKLILYIISYLIIGYDVLFKAIKNVFTLRLLDENFLMGIATVGAFFIKDYQEASFVMLFYQIGEIFQYIAVERSRKSIKDLMGLRPDIATLIIDNEEKVISPWDLKIGDYILVKPGEKIPVDGIIIDNDTTLDTSKLTGETLPKDVKSGDLVLSGSVNITKTIKMRVEKEFGESTATKILDLVENATQNKAKSENFITKFAVIYTPIVVILAFLLAFIPPLILGFTSNFEIYLYRALSFLVISCPCALVISVPLGFFAGIGVAARNNILIKGSNYLETLSKVDTIVFDKTGTLTKGNFKVTKIVPIEISEEELVRYAVIAECQTNHPIGLALKEYKPVNISLDDCQNFEQIIGEGVSVDYLGQTIYAGNNKLMKRNNISHLALEEMGTIIHVAKNHEYLGYIIIQDEIRPESKSSIKTLKKLGIKKCIMLTGDRHHFAKSVADELEIDEVKSELLPDEKVKLMSNLKESEMINEKVAFVGDGINDAPALAISDVGISMGGIGSDAAIEASDIVLINDEIAKIPLAIKISKKTNKIVKENIAFIIGIKIIILILSALGIAHMGLAIFADVGVCVLAILNSLRIFDKKINLS